MHVCYQTNLLRKWFALFLHDFNDFNGRWLSFFYRVTIVMIISTRPTKLHLKAGYLELSRKLTEQLNIYEL